MRLADELDHLVVVGKVDPEPGPMRYALAPHTGFVELPYYASLTRPGEALAAMSGSLLAFWRVLDQVDGVWLLGPHPLAIGFAALAAVRRKSIALGVRQDFPRYVRRRNPGRRWTHVTADLLQAVWNWIARFVPVIAVGPALAAEYRRETTIEIGVSLVRESDIVPAALQAQRSYAQKRVILSVGRLEEEKNPLLLAEIIASLRERDPRWRLVVCGEGPLEGALRRRVSELGVSDHVELLGYVPHDGALRDLYRRSHALLHVSWTEGLPQVLFEAFAARLPVVATAVGGVPAAAADAALLVEPGDGPAAVDALERLSDDAELRQQLTEAGVRHVSKRTLDAEAQRVARFLSARSAENVEAAYAHYAARARKRRAWSSSNAGNRAALMELEREFLARAAPELGSGGKILDVGCGTGGWLQALSAYVDTDRLYGIDAVSSRVQAAQSALPDAHFTHADARSLPFADGTFMLVLLFTVLTDLRRLQDIQRVQLESDRVLAPGGLLVIYEPRLPNPFNPFTRAIRRRDITLAARSRTVTLFPPLARRLGPWTPSLYPLLAMVRPLRTHRLWWYHKPVPRAPTGSGSR